VGKNQLTITVLDHQRQPVNDARLRAVAEMPAMGSMPTMQAPAEISEIGNGQYQGSFEPSMSGEWPLTIVIMTKDAEPARISLDLATGRKGLRCTSCGTAGVDAVIPGTVHINYERRQVIGVTSRKVRNKRIDYSIRASGVVTYDETRLTDVTLKFDGWIGELYANYVGKPVHKGDPLFTVYSPELLSVQEEYLESVRRSTASGKPLSVHTTAAQHRLMLWDITDQQINAIRKQGEATEYLPMLSPVNGIVVEKPVVQGSAVRKSQPVLRIADLSTLWVEGRVYEYELPLLKPGMEATVTMPALGERRYTGKVTYLSPYIDEKTHTAIVRVELDNSNGLLRPAMFANVNIEADLGKRLVVPEEAVLYSGEQRIVFIDLGDGRLQPRKIKTGVQTERWIEVTEGLNEDDQVVTSGNFLIASESKLKSGLAQW
jgi:Cu(I)/Ag(I) efflux system membrane fusion protein